MNTTSLYAEVLIQFLLPEVGGRTAPVFLQSTYRPHFRIGDSEYLGVQFVDGPDNPIHPGSSSHATVKFVYSPGVNYDALQVGVQFQVLEGSSIVGIGRVTRR